MKQIAIQTPSISEMRLAIVCLLTTVTTVQSENAKITNFHTTVQRNRRQFEDRILKEFDGSKILISPRAELTLEDVTAIEDENFITLKDLKLVNQPALRILSLNSTLDLFSTRLAIDVEDLVFSGQIYVNEDTEPAGDVRYTLRNFKGSGLVGLAVAHGGHFVSTNYLINYTEDETKLETAWGDRSLDEQRLDHLLFFERQLKKGVRKVVNRLFKKRFDAALAGISASRVFGLGISNVLEIEKSFQDWNSDIVDGILDDLNKLVEEYGMTQIVLPDFDEPFTYRVLGISLNGRVLGSEGWIRNLATFARQGPVSLSHGAGNLIIFGSLGLTELRLGYDACAVKVIGIGPSGHVSGTVGTNRADLSLLINVRNQSITLDKFEITELSDIEIEVTGLGPFNWLASKIANIVLAASRTYLVSTVEPIIKKQLNKALANLVLIK